MYVVYFVGLCIPVMLQGARLWFVVVVVVVAVASVVVAVAVVAFVVNLVTSCNHVTHFLFTHC